METEVPACRQAGILKQVKDDNREEGYFVGVGVMVGVIVGPVRGSCSFWAGNCAGGVGMPSCCVPLGEVGAG